MFKKLLKKKGSAYLLAIGALGILGICFAMISKSSISGRWNTTLTSNGKKAEECAESATNLMFKVVKDNMNDYSIFYKTFPFPTILIEGVEKKEIFFMFFRLPAVMAVANMDPVKFKDSKENGVDVQLDLFNNGLFSKLYDKGVTFIYDTANVSSDNSRSVDSPLAPLQPMLDSMGGRVRIQCNANIKQAFGILSESRDYNVGGVEVPLTGVTGFMGKLFDKIKVKGQEIQTKIEDKLGKDPTDDGNEGGMGINLISFLPNKPLLKAPDISKITVIVEGVPAPIGWLLQPLLNKIFEKIVQAANLTPRGLAEMVFGDSLTINIDLSAITNKIEDAIKNCLPECLQAFVGKVGWGITVEKQGIFQVETTINYWPKYKSESDKGELIVRKLIAQRDFRVADVQPIAPDYSYFVANSKLLYANYDVENEDDWKGNEKINWNDGTGDLRIHNMPSLKSIINTLKNLFTFNFKDLLREVQLPALVRVNYADIDENGNKTDNGPMELKITMLPKLSFSLDFFKQMEILSILIGHRKGEGVCKDSGGLGHSHSGDYKNHNPVPDLKSVMYNFFDEGKPFDWGYFGGGSPGGAGSYWLPIPPRFGRTQFFGDFHLEFPLSLRVEGYMKKVYSHIKMLLVKIYIPPIPIIGFLGMDIPIPWFWAWAEAEPYGFCRWPGYDLEKEDDAKTNWNPNEDSNLPANIYSPAQYLKKASYFYETSMDFEKDIENRSIEYNGKKTFVCDGVTFVNENLWLKDMHVMGRGIIVSAGNIHLNGNITREDFDRNGNPTLFSIVARNGSVLTGFSKREVYACVFADKGVQCPIGGGLTIHGNLCVNRANRKDIGGDVHVYYESNHCRSSLMSMIRPVAKYDPTRYHVTLSSKLASFQFVETDDSDVLVK